MHVGLLICAISSAEAVQYTIVDLGTLPGDTQSWANGINNSGQVVGESGGEAFLWQGGVTQDLGPGAADAINNSGQVVGMGYFWDRTIDVYLTLPALWQDGTMTSLGAGMVNSAPAINNAGQIVIGPHPCYIWQNEALTRLPGRAQGINDSGQVVGGFGLWQNGVVTSIGALPGYPYSMAYAINNNGQVVG